MKVNEAITQIDTLKPNQYEEAEKVRWLSTLDGRIAEEVYAAHEGTPSGFVPYDPKEDLDAVLLAPEPFADVYLTYLAAQIDYYNGETARYNNSMVMFNIAYEGFANWVNRTYRPKQPAYVRVSL